MKILKKLRKSHGLKLHEVAERLKITPQTVFNQERDGIHTVRVAKKYAVLYECKPEELLEFD